MKKDLDKWVVYILRCGDGRLYTGITNDLWKRISAHQSGKGAKFTRGRGPFEVVYVDELPNKSHAAKNEAAIKKLSRRAKLQMVVG